MPPLRLMNRSSGSSIGLPDIAYRNARDHLDRVRLSTLRGSEVQRITAANGSSPSNGVICLVRAPQRGSQPATRPPNRRRRPDTSRLHPVLGWPGFPPRRFEPAEDPASRLSQCTVHPPAPAFLFGATLAKSTNAFLQSSSFQNHSF